MYDIKERYLGQNILRAETAAIYISSLIKNHFGKNFLIMDNKVLFITDTYKDLNIKKDTPILMIEEAIKNKLDVFQ